MAAEGAVAYALARWSAPLSPRRLARGASSPWAVILTYPTFLIPFSPGSQSAIFKMIPREIGDSPRIDRPSRTQAIVRICFALAVPGILSAGIFRLPAVVAGIPLCPSIPPVCAVDGVPLLHVHRAR